DWRRRIYDHYRQSCHSGFVRFLLREPLRTLVRADHLIDRSNDALVRQHAIARNRHRPYRAGINESFYPGAPCGLKQVSRALDVGFINLAWVTRPQAIIGSHMINSGHSSEGLLQRPWIAQIAPDALDGQTFEQSGLACRAEQHADPLSALSQQPHDVAAQKSARARD